MSKHTMTDYGEPWEVFDSIGHGWWYVASADGSGPIVATDICFERHAKRIVACVNAMQGVEDPQKEKIMVKEPNGGDVQFRVHGGKQPMFSREQALEIERLTEINRQLLMALERALEIATEDDKWSLPERETHITYWLQQARQAIVKAKNETS